MAKQPALITRYKTASTRVTELEKQLLEANAKIKDLTARSEALNASQRKLESEIEQVHQVLDTVPNSIARKSDNEDQWQRVERSIVTRFAAWLAARP